MRTNWSIRLEFKPQDFWVGAYWKRAWWGIRLDGKKAYRFDLWICLVPMFPIHLTVHRTWNAGQ